MTDFQCLPPTTTTISEPGVIDMLAGDTKQISDHAISRIERAPIHLEPFSYIIIDNFLPDSFFKDLMANFPDRSRFERVSYPGTGHGRRTSRFHENGLALKDMKNHEYFGSKSTRFAITRPCSASPGMESPR